ncbi:hypothetical protein M9H77_06779 [Catharanthus roseus]|uniref:Uncharacterized protein n=1 Tax=Catharanthus roseus TaxID=4058 RepID=A0ACC0BT30_CATRO|nr:hypothetical protein M9H77_06779 [Catharanthus roseus]
MSTMRWNASFSDLPLQKGGQDKPRTLKRGFSLFDIIPKIWPLGGLWWSINTTKNYHTKINIIFPTKSQTTKLTKSRDNVRIVEAKRTKSARNFGGAEELNFLAEDD